MTDQRRRRRAELQLYSNEDEHAELELCAPEKWLANPAPDWSDAVSSRERLGLRQPSGALEVVGGRKRQRAGAVQDLAAI